jgi:3-mercaptopyruvate sulfurtransferase SseA
MPYTNTDPLVHASSAAHYMQRRASRAQDAFVDVRHGRYIGEHIPGARYVQLEGEDLSLS